MNARTDDHTWFTQRALQHAVGLLDEQDEHRCNEHLESCEECRELFARADEDERARGQDRHIPSAMLARWGRAESDLSGLERQSVAAHLSRCTQCREDLRTFGHEPVLAADPIGSASVATEEMPSSRLAEIRAWLFGGVSGLAVGAIAAALVFMMVSPPPTSDVLPWVAPSRTRGAASTLEVPSGTHEVTLTLGVPTACDLAREAIVEVTGPDGTTITRTTIPPRVLAQSTVLVVIRSESSLPLGEYEVVFSQSGMTDELSRFELTSAGD